MRHAITALCLLLAGCHIDHDLGFTPGQPPAAAVPAVDPSTAVTSLACNGTLLLPSIPSTFATFSLRNLASGDFNGDGDLDLATTNEWNGLTDVLLGRGDGTFSRAGTYDVRYGAYITAIVSGDFNGDGKTDLVIPHGQITTLVGNGDGTFQSIAIAGTGAGQGWATAGDFNSDGKLDLASTTWDSKSVTFHMGRGDGTFEAPSSTGPPSMALLAADFDRNGTLDLALDSALLLGNGDGTFRQAASFIGHAPLASADLNGDGRVDLITATEVFLGNGDGTFGTAVPFVSEHLGGEPFMIPGDFNGDSKLDVAVVGYAIGMLVGNGDGTFQPLRRLTPDIDAGMGALAADLNHDGRSDLIPIIYTSANVNTLLGNSDGTLRTDPTYATTGIPESARAATSLLVADLNGDGKPDIVTSDGLSPPFSVLPGEGDGTFGPVVLSAPGDAFSHSSASLGDFNGDGKPDLFSTGVVNAGNGSGNARVWLGKGDLTLTAQPSFALELASSSVAGDFDRDGKLDVAVAHSFGNLSSMPRNGATILLGNGDGTFKPPSRFETDPAATAIAAADLNHDGFLDLVTANEGIHDQPTTPVMSTISVLLANGDGSFKPFTAFAVGALPSAVTAADVNADGHADIATVNQGSRDVSVLLGRGDGTFQAAVSYPTQAYPINGGGHSIAAADVNHDGIIDLAATGEGDQISLLFGIGDGTFRPVVNYLSHSVFFLAVADLNADGRLDIAATHGADREARISIHLSSGCLP